MNKLYSHNSFFSENLLVLIGVCMCAYFSYHAIAGSRSLVRLYFVNQQIETLSKKETLVQAEEAVWSKKVAMMRPASINKDLLEEQVRRVLGYRGKDEMAVLSN